MWSILDPVGRFSPAHCQVYSPHRRADRRLVEVGRLERQNSSWAAGQRARDGTQALATKSVNLANAGAPGDRQGAPTWCQVEAGPHGPRSSASHAVVSATFGYPKTPRPHDPVPQPSQRHDNMIGFLHGWGNWCSAGLSRLESARARARISFSAARLSP